MLHGDIKLYVEVKSADDLSCFQACISSLHQWTLVSQLFVSSHKCCTFDICRPTGIYETRVRGRWSNTARVHGPWTLVVCTGL